MSKYICQEYGACFNEPGTCRCSQGEFWGSPAYETMDCCPYCGGSFEENLSYNLDPLNEADNSDDEWWEEDKWRLMII